MPRVRVTRHPLPFRLTGAAFVWSLLLMAGAFWVPVYSGSGFGTTSTLVAVNGLWVLAPVCVPAVLTAFTWVALHRKCSRDSRAAGFAASAVIAVLAAFNLVAMFSIGVFILPVTLLLVCAARLTRGAAQAPGASTAAAPFGV